MPNTPKTQNLTIDLAVLGAGPGGYTAAFRAADLGLKVALIERHPTLGGVCLNVGCIPSKALLHAAEVINAAAAADALGIHFTQPKVDMTRLLEWKAGVVGRLTGGLATLAEKRKVEVLYGDGQFTSPNTLEVRSAEGARSVTFKQAVIAAGSAPIEIPGFPHDDPRVIDSTAALTPPDIPKHMLVIGGGVIGMEMATVYHALGTRISVVEAQERLMAEADADIVRPLAKRAAARFDNLWLSTTVSEMKATSRGIRVAFAGEQAPEGMTFDRVLVCVGRRPNGHDIGAAAAGVAVTEHGFITVDEQQRTNVPHLFAIGDIVGAPMLAHKAAHEGKVAAEVAAGEASGFDGRVIPAVAYTDPEVAWVGMTESELKRKGIPYGKGVFPWAASGRALSQGNTEGVTKLLFAEDSRRLLGAGICGAHAGELIAAATLAIEMGADAEDIALTIHPHPTLSETIGFAAEVFSGVITDLYLPKKAGKRGR